MPEFNYSIYYDIFHPDSDEHRDRVVKESLQYLESRLPDDRAAPILDIGCGYGYALLALKELGYLNVEGIEASEQQATRARREGLKVEIVADTIAWLESRSNSFSAVLLIDVLEHIEVVQQINFLRAINRSLAPGGRVIIRTPNANAILASRWRYNDYTHHSSFTEHSLFFVLKNAGFDDVRISSEKGLVQRWPKRLWRRKVRYAFRKQFIRWCWLQVFKAELTWDPETIANISFELNLDAVAYRRD